MEKDIWDLLEKLELVEEVSGGVLLRGGRDASTLQPPCTHGEHYKDHPIVLSVAPKISLLVEIDLGSFCGLGEC